MTEVSALTGGIRGILHRLGGPAAVGEWSTQAAQEIAEYVTRPTPTSEQTELVARLTNFLPRNVCLTNRNVSDDTIVPLECSMGELRALADLIEALSSAPTSNTLAIAGEALREAREALAANIAGSEMLARHYKIDLCNDVENGSAYHRSKKALATIDKALLAVEGEGPSVGTMR